MDEQVLIEVVWENQTKAQARLRVQPFATLRDMHNALVSAKPAFDSRDYCYMYEGQPIFREFWDVFEAQCFNKKLYMRPGTYTIKNIEGTAIIPVPSKKTTRSTMNSPATPPLAKQPTPSQTPTAAPSIKSPAIKSAPVEEAKRPAPAPVAAATQAATPSEPAKPRTGTQTANKPTVAPKPSTPVQTPAAAEPAKPANKFTGKSTVAAATTPAPAPHAVAAPAKPAGSRGTALGASSASVSSAATATTTSSTVAGGGASPLPQTNEESEDADPDVIPSPPTTSRTVKKVEALYGYKARSVDQLTFHKGDVMEILIYRPKGKWWFAKLADKKGWVPHNFVRAVDEGAPTGATSSSPSSGKDAPEVSPSVEVDMESDEATAPPPAAAQKSKLTVGKR
eukprot:TRINITY_DN2681_c0_g1_i1.p1 TRINITY_DN2681_c0_g1~~TRINITY_DN2681_c0_g1_i1.p1  ORF type:complete len:395 (-),score=84.23 TRINITY_DN2681_c0_g1_i1:127-1311(-)